jgi:dihydrodipicolinate synthase/N-acetylneuraminate lyase
VISGCACAIPEVLVALGKAITAGDELHAGEIDKRLREFIERIERFPAPVGIRRAVELRGKKSGPPLAPLSPAAETELQEFSTWFRAWLPVVRKEAAGA